MGYMVDDEEGANAAKLHGQQVKEFDQEDSDAISSRRDPTRTGTAGVFSTSRGFGRGIFYS